MKKVSIFAVIAVSAMFFISCGKEGPQGPAGPKGDTGAPGPNGVVYSNWTNFTAATWTAFNAQDVASYPINGIAALTQTLLDRGAIRVFIKKAGNTAEAFSLPLLDQGTLDVYNLDFVAALNKITLRCLDLGGSPNPAGLLASFAQFRYVLIPGGVAGKAQGQPGGGGDTYNGYTQQQLLAMPYAQLCQALEIPQ